MNKICLAALFSLCLLGATPAQANPCQSVSAFIVKSSAAISGSGTILKTLGIAAAKHSSGAYIVTSSSSYLAGTLGTIGGAISFVTAPATITFASSVAVAAGTAWLVCSMI